MGNESVFLGSTSRDLQVYRQAAMDACTQVHMVPIVMEYFETMGKGATASSLAQLDKADVYVGFFAYRYGHIEEGYDRSVSELEYDHAGHRGIDRLCFLIDPDHPWKVGLIEHDKLPQLEAFKNRMRKECEPRPFTDVADFRNKVVAHLLDWQRRRTAAPPRASAIFPESYRSWLLDRHSDVGLLGLTSVAGSHVPLSDIYVPLTTSTLLPIQRPVASGVRPEDTHSGTRTQSLLLDHLAEASLYVTSEAGEGKSTFCQWVTIITCLGRVPDVDENGNSPDLETSEPYRERFPESLKGRLPLLIPLSELWRHFPERSGGRNMARVELEKSIADWFEVKQPPDLHWPVVQAHLNQGSALLIFDGVDEVPRMHSEEGLTWSPKEMLVAALSDAIYHWSRLGNRVLLTGRPYGLEDDETARIGLRHTPIADLPDDLKTLLVRRWCAVREYDSAKRGETAANLMDSLSRRRYTDSLTANPLLLSAACLILAEDNKGLPQTTHDLYDRIVDCILSHRLSRDRVTIERIRQQLSAIAFAMHTGAWLDEGRPIPQPEITYDEIDHVLDVWRKELGAPQAMNIDTVESRERLLRISGLFLPRTWRRAGFYRAVFQDFFAAQRFLREVKEPERLVATYFERSSVPEWHWTLMLIFDGLLYTSVSPNKAIQVVERLMGTLSDRPESNTLPMVRLGTHVAECVRMLKRRNIDIAHLQERFRQFCLATIAHGPPVHTESTSLAPPGGAPPKNRIGLYERLQLALVLGELGDPRISLDEGSAYVEIPAGYYAFSDANERWRLEKPFRITRYPVTNSQFALFLEQNGYEDARYWSFEGRQWLEKEKVSEPLHWRNPKYNGATQPVTGICYWEAEAFATWAGARLPMEKEWEAAARGPEGYTFPWGDEWAGDGCCNTHEAGLNTTTPVGLFPQSRSATYGLEDLAGNVWEWCADSNNTDFPAWKVGDSTLGTLKPGEGRMLRGGSFLVGAKDVRATNRRCYRPEGRGLGGGFRVVRS